MAYALACWHVFRQVQITFRGVYSDCDLVLTGHLGSIGVGQVALGTVAQLRDSESAVLYSYDPVIGDRNDGVYVVDALTAVFRDVALRAANILAPNQFELEVLAGCPTGARDDYVPDNEIRGPCAEIAATEFCVWRESVNNVRKLAHAGDRAK
jgi:pyridoxal/pyridoxine/pyridoxamine kinase